MRRASREEIIASYNLSKEELGARKREKKNVEDRLLATEVDYVNLYNRTDVADLENHLDVIDYSRLQHLLDGKFYSPYVMFFFSRILLAIYQRKKVEGLDLESIRNWLEKVEKLSVGVDGVTLEATLRGMFSPDVIVKVPKRNVNPSPLAHEVFIGLYGTNFLRQFIPNFSFVYGGFNCSSPIMLPDQVLEICGQHTQEGINYALYENVAPSVTFEQALTILPSTEILNLYFVTVLALQKAYEKMSFSHFDLHLRNVLIRELEEEVIIPYVLQNSTFYIRTRYIPTIIDYGRSSIVYRGQTYYPAAFPLFAGLGDVTSFPLYDAYRLLTTLYFSSAPKETKNVLFSLISFFVSEFDEKLTVDLYSVLPTRMAQYDLSEFISFILTFSPTCVTDSPSSNLFSCINSSCSNLAKLKGELYLTREPKATSLFTLYSILADEGNIDNIAQRFPEIKIVNISSRVEKNLSRYAKMERGVPILDLSRLNTQTSYNSFYYAMEYVVKLKQLQRKIEESISMLLYVAPYYSVINVDALEQVSNFSNFEYMEYLSSIYQVLKEESLSYDVSNYLQILGTVVDYVR